MHLDQTTLLTAAGLSSAALAIAFLSSWFLLRTERHPLFWSTGLVVIIVALILFNSGDGYPVVLRYPALALLIAGFAFIDCGSSLFCDGRMRWKTPFCLAVAGIAATSWLFYVGQSGAATGIANVAIAGLLLRTGWRFWMQRHEALLGMGAVAMLYTLLALSFLSCAVVLLVSGPYVLTAQPANWAEELNAIASIVGLTSIGAITFALMHYRSSQEHRRAALTDPLTQLPNRRALTNRFMDGPVAAGTCLVLFDLDHFKSINDRFGHAHGDAVLVHFAAILSANLPAGGLAARLGGEEFGTLLERATAPEAHAFGEAVRLAFAASPVAAGETRIVATVTGGFAIAADGSETGVALFSRADRALYDAKRAGRNRVHGAQPELVAVSGARTM